MTASVARKRLSAIFIHAIASGLATSDPAEVIKGALAPLQKGRRPAIIEIDALRDMLRAAEDIPSHPITALAMRFLALTAVRPGEVHGMSWHELDGAIWRIPKERVKMRKPHAVPLSWQAVEILEAVRVLTGRGPMVFPNARRAQPALQAFARKA
ncbi:tyrosine-type recombinase/integrase [Gluconacetobacter azotocaptans]|uniref:Tyrosine-type recombinase/integrase n=1 Tax=Gluconacetobacter azotocaptans TaxID=142834 RepID=A0A7W4PFE9_9PROT|nr:tyrosine-type recombinase/integrase [Gluconacetobacter azotocaptans]